MSLAKFWWRQRAAQEALRNAGTFDPVELYRDGVSVGYELEQTIAVKQCAVCMLRWRRGASVYECINCGATIPTTTRTP